LDRESDEELLRRFLDGEERAFTQLVKRHEDRIFALCLRMTGARPDALEAAQETFLAAFRRAGSFRGESAFSTWLYRIGINCCKDLLRRRGRAPQPVDETAVEVDRSGASSLDELAALRVDVARALARLPDDYREAVALHDLGGLPYEQIAKLTGVAIGTVKSRISRGRRRLGELLEQGTEGSASKPYERLGPAHRSEREDREDLQEGARPRRDGSPAGGATAP